MTTKEARLCRKNKKKIISFLKAGNVYVTVLLLKATFATRFAFCFLAYTLCRCPYLYVHHTVTWYFNFHVTSVALLSTN